METFPTVVYANPEEVAAFKLGTALADETGAKIVMANDPECRQNRNSRKG